MRELMELNDLQQSVIDVLFEAGAVSMHSSLPRESIQNALATVPGLVEITGNALGPCLAGLNRRGLVQKHLNECWSLTDESAQMVSADEEDDAPVTWSPGYVGNPDDETLAGTGEGEALPEDGQQERECSVQPETLALGPGRIQKLTHGLSTSINQLRNQHDDELQAELLAVIDGLGELAAQEYKRTADPCIGDLPGVCAELRRRVERARICSDVSDEVAA
ncbi:hypothetical protein SAMN05661010_02539 [Modicisalibacter muralis]|uniref:Uncharacterized protein n=1 Tax=Modicisalibacter muralis TaxID=119000 RepID=A0A1G9MVN0_9GAMM|nr:hypothetical protein [Halomonas muralis]SDL78288.1 hypothetical protein SAMN05661010_02539 [Halomonas muralis]